MERLGDMMTRTFDLEPEDFMGETRGRPRLLKTYIMEVNSELPRESNGTSLQISRTETKLPEISVLSLISGRKHARFFVDTSDKRFWLLHTTDLADNVDWLYNKLVSSPDANLDKAWLPIEMMESVAGLSGNSFRGFGLRYTDYSALDGEGEGPVAELRMHFSGSSPMDAFNALKAEKKLRRSLSYSMVRVKRGNRSDYVIEELDYQGRFIAKGGTSIDDYVGLIEITRKLYRDTIEAIERNSLGIKEVEGRTLIEGQAFDLTLEREILDIDSFIDQLVSSQMPFRLWGIKNKISKNHYQVICVDLHTGDSIDLEISPFLIRIYLPKDSCGNTVLRLYSNLQHHFDSLIKLNGESLQISK